MKEFIGKIDKRTINAIIITILFEISNEYIWPLLREHYSLLNDIRDYRKLLLVIILIVPALLIERQSLTTLGFTLRKTKNIFLAAILASVFTLVLVLLISIMWKMLGQLYVEGEYIYFIGNKIPHSQITFILPFILFIPQIFSVALPEELIYRGYFQSRIGYTWGPIIGIIASSIVFSLVHIDRPLMLVHLVIQSPVFGYVYYKTKSIYPTVIAHAIGNTFCLLIIQCVALM